MTRARVAAGVATVVTVVLLQATLVGPGLAPITVSLPAVVVAAVALVDGPAVGMSFGFAAGLVTDLASRHPAGTLALAWLVLGLVAGRLGERRNLGWDAVSVGALCGLTSSAVTLLLTVVGRGGTLRDAATGLGPSVLAGTVLALAVVPLVRRALRTEYLRAPQAGYTELVMK